MPLNKETKQIFLAGPRIFQPICILRYTDRGTREFKRRK